MSVKIELKKTEELVRELVIEVPAERVGSEMDKKFADYRKKADIKGFRRGKVPMNMIKSLYGDEVRAMVADELVKSTLNEAVREKELRPAGTPSLTEIDFNEAGDLVYTVKLEIFPEPEEISLTNLKVSNEDPVVADEEVNEISELYRQRFAETRVVGREVKEDDIVVCDLAKKSDPRKVIDQDRFEAVEIDLSKGVTVKEFRDNLPGMKAGDRRDIEVTYADDYPEEKFRGARIVYDCTVKEVKEKLLPEFDDALAKRTQQAETALELKLKIRKDLEQEKQDVIRNKQRGELIRMLCEENPVPVPDGLVEEYLDAMVKDYKTKFPDADEQEIRSGYRDNSINTIRWNLLYHQLAEQEKIEVSPADTENWIKGFAAANDMDVERAKLVLSKSGRVGNVRESILEQKVLDFLASKATPVEPEKK